MVYRVCDNGVGLEDNDTEEIFKLFCRLRPEMSPNGQGIGLNIAKKLLSRCDGKVWVESNIDNGCSFYISLPIAKHT